MTDETKRLIQSLKTKASTIITEVERLKQENGMLKQELETTVVELDNSRVKHNELESKYEALKIAKALNNGDDNSELKKQIDAMVREIDTCIELVEQ